MTVASTATPPRESPAGSRVMRSATLGGKNRARASRSAARRTARSVSVERRILASQEGIDHSKRPVPGRTWWVSDEDRHADERAQPDEARIETRPRAHHRQDHQAAGAGEAETFIGGRESGDGELDRDHRAEVADHRVVALSPR